MDAESLKNVHVLGEVTYKDRNYLKLSEDVGGLTLIATFVRTDLLTTINTQGTEK